MRASLRFHLGWEERRAGAALGFFAILSRAWAVGAKLSRKNDPMGWPRGERDTKLIAFVGFAVLLLMFLAAILAYSLVRP